MTHLCRNSEASDLNEEKKKKIFKKEEEAWLWLYLFFQGSNFLCNTKKAVYYPDFGMSSDL